MLNLNIDLSFPFPAKVLRIDFRAASLNASDEATVALSLIPSEKPKYLINLFFTGVRGLHINHAGSEGVDCVLFEADDMSAAQWEGVNWRVGDYKIDVIGFYARTAEVVSIEKSD